MKGMSEELVLSVVPTKGFLVSSTIFSSFQARRIGILKCHLKLASAHGGNIDPNG